MPPEPPAALVTSQTATTLGKAEATATPGAKEMRNWVKGMQLSRALADDAQAIHSFEASATFAIEDRDELWRNLPRLLVSQPSALKRRALWAASSKVGSQLGILVQARRTHAAKLLAPATELEFRAQVREVSPTEISAAAEALLDATDGAWKDTVAALATSNLKLPPEVVTLADLPRLLKVNRAADAVFPTGEAARLGMATLREADSVSDARFDFAATERKQPLPLTVAVGEKDVRLSYRPADGLRDAMRLLSEIGTALALNAASDLWRLASMGDPARAEVAAYLFEGLLGDARWLLARGVNVAKVGIVADAVRAERLYALRRACLSVLLEIRTAGLGEGDARVVAVDLVARAFGIRSNESDGARLLVQYRDELRSASALKAMCAAAKLRSSLPPNWWAAPATVHGLMRTIAVETSVAAPDAQCRAALVDTLRNPAVPVAVMSLSSAAHRGS